MYINCHTYYSLKYGTLSPTQLVEHAQKNGAKSLVLTDINNTSCAYEFIQLCEQANIKPILGLECHQGQRCQFIGIARNVRGWSALNQWWSMLSLTGKPIPATLPPLDGVFVVYPRLIKPIQQFKPHEFLGVRPEHVNRLYGNAVLERPDRLLVWQPVTFADEEGYTVHRLLRAIDHNVVLSKLTSADLAKRTETFIPLPKLRQSYAHYPQIIANTEKLLDQCHIQLEKGLQNNRQSFTGSKDGDYTLLEKLAVNGCYKRYGTPRKQHSSDPAFLALERVKKELGVIRKLDFCSYFLITWDIIRYAQSSGYHHVGRGSGANSIVAYCLYMTDVDPMELDLYFERFINPYRSSPPDFDIDFSWDERDDIIDYIFKRYGSNHTALLATYSTFKGRSIIRELGKVFGLPKPDIDQIVHYPEDAENNHELAASIFHYGQKMEGFPSHLSIHAGGIVIAEQPIFDHTAIQMMPKGFPITHFDMYHAEALGFHKFDILSQRGLGHLKDAVTLIQHNQGKAVDIHEVEKIKKDHKVRGLLRQGKCMGCFYIESPAMRGLLSKLQCEDYVHLVAASSIIRPGVARSGMMREYIRRFHQPNAYDYLHPVFEEHLGETFGIMVYQEDVMKIVHHFAGLDLDESDVLRRIMSGKKYRNDTFARLKKKYFDNCRARQHSESLTQEVWRQVESFSGYSFCKAHSASFAVESFQSLYLKAYYPLEFMVAVINNFGGFYKTEFYFHEARILGACIHAPCINNSDILTDIQGKDIYIGFTHLYQLERKVAKLIIHQRRLGGPYKNLEDFVHRVDISSEQLDILIRIGAFRFTGRKKSELMWEKNAVLNPSATFTNTIPLFEDDLTSNFELPELTEHEYDQAFDEIELLGFPLINPFALLQKTSWPQSITANNLMEKVGKDINILGYFVCSKNVRTINKKYMNFGTWLDKNGHFFDTTHFPQSLQHSPFRGSGVYHISGQVVIDFGFPSIEVNRMERLPYRKDERY